MFTLRIPVQYTCDNIMVYIHVHEEYRKSILTNLIKRDPTHGAPQLYYITDGIFISDQKGFGGGGGNVDLCVTVSISSH